LCLFLFGYEHALPSNLLVKKNLKINPTIKKGKIIIFFIILGARPTFTPGPERDQLVF
jgi:hypothetical protein